MSYFAAKPVNDLLPELKDRITNYHKYKETNGEADAWRRSYDLYYGRHVDQSANHQVTHVGEDEELTAYGVNYYRNLIKHVLAITCSQKPSYDYRAKNTDLASLQQAKLANNIIDSYLVEKRMGRHMKQAAERSLVFKLGYVYLTWEPSLGKPLMAEPVLGDDGQPMIDDDGQPIKKIKYEGDPRMVSKSPWEVVHDVSLRDWANCNWVIVTEYENKYDLSAQYPKKKEEIEKLQYGYELEEFGYRGIKKTILNDENSDLIAVHHFYHLPTASLPSGRYTKFLNANTSLYDGAYQYPSKSGNHKLPIHRITPGEMFDTTDGYTEFYDIMVLQQVLNILHSTIFTNQSAFGTQAIWLPDGCELSVEQLGKGLAVLRGGSPDSQPRPLQLTATPSEIFKNADTIKSAMKELAGLNDAITGNIEQKDMSGVALGRLQAMAIQFSSNFQASWAEIQEDCGTGLLHLLQDFANTKRITAIAGKRNKGAMKSWTGADINMIDRLVCDLGNPLSRTYAGRMDTADKFLDKGLIKDPTQYFQLIETGNIDPMLEAPTSKLELIRKENEMLMEGKPVKAMVGDTHIQHAQEHRVVMDDPEVRMAAEGGDQFAISIIQNTLAHLAEHENLQATQSPFWFAVSGEQPPQPPMMPPPPGQGGPPMESPPGAPMMDEQGLPPAPPLPPM